MIILDTQALVWLLFDDPKLGRQARQVIGSNWPSGEVAVSSITYWEVAMLHDKGRLALLVDIGSWRMSLLEDGLAEVPVDGAITVRAALLTDIHGDPADRIILATALEGHQLVTADQRMLGWPGSLNRLDARE